MTAPSPATAELLSEWRDHLTHGLRRSPHTVRAYVAAAVRLLASCEPSGAQSVTQLTSADLRRHLGERRAQGIGNASTARELSALRTFLAYASSRQGVAEPGIGRIKGPRIKKGIPRPLTPDDAVALADDVACHAREAWIGLRNRAVLLLLYGSGLRIAEALSLRGEHAAVGESLLVTGKGGRQRMVPVLPVVREAIAAYVSACPYPLSPGQPLFRGAKGGPLNQGMVQKAVAAGRATLGLPPSATPHALRHSFASHLLGEGADLRSLQELLGHASLGSTQIYTRVDASRMLDAYRSAHPRERAD